MKEGGREGGREEGREEGGYNNVRYHFQSSYYQKLYA